MIKRYIYLFFAISLLSPSVLLAKEPSDPLFEQWGYKEVQAYDAWDKSTGSRDVVVAVIDNGFDYLHPDLVDNVWKNENEIAGNNWDDDGNGYVDDVWGWNFVPDDFNGDGEIDQQEELGNNNPRPPVFGFDKEDPAYEVIHHGTVVAGIIGAVGDNAQLGSGLNWEVKLMNLRLLGNEGRGQVTALDRAIRYAVDNGADIINFSIVSNSFEASTKKAIDYAYDHGVVIVAAAGNNSLSLNDSPLYPICADKDDGVIKVLGVSAIRQDRRIAAFSNYGSDCIDITAPGVEINSTLRYSPMQGFEEKYGEGWSGTSFAAPFVSATAALIKAVQPQWGAKEIYEAILSTTHKTPPQSEDVYENLFGKGLLQIDNALGFALEKKQAQEQYPEPDPTQTPESKEDFVIQQISLSKGIIRIKYPNNLAIGRTIEVPELAGMQHLSAYERGEYIQYIATRYSAQEGKTEITLFNQDWQLQKKWFVDSRGPMRSALVDIEGSGVPHVVLAPSYNDTELFRVYDQEGNFIDSQSQAAIHQGVVISSMRDQNDLKDDIIVSYRASTHPTIARYARAGEKIIEFISEQFINPGAISSADLNGDGKDEFIVSSAPTEPIMVVYYRADGQLLKNFPSYAPGTKIDVDLSVWDYNQDGKEDIIITPKHATNAMQIWTHQPLRIFYFPIIEKSLAPIRIFMTPVRLEPTHT